MPFVINRLRLCEFVFYRNILFIQTIKTGIKPRNHKKFRPQALVSEMDHPFLTNTTRYRTRDRTPLSEFYFYIFSIYFHFLNLELSGGYFLMLSHTSYFTVINPLGLTLYTGTPVVFYCLKSLYWQHYNCKLINPRFPK